MKKSDFKLALNKGETYEKDIDSGNDDACGNLCPG